MLHKINKKKGFVLMETIIVISVLSIILLTIYISYNNILIMVKKHAVYNNTEYVYKTSLVRDYLISRIDLSKSFLIENVCNNVKSDVKDCYNEKNNSNYDEKLYKSLGVEAIYITRWNKEEIKNEIKSLEATTQLFINSLDDKSYSGYRIIVMFKQENNLLSTPIYEYATLKFGRE